VEFSVIWELDHNRFESDDHLPVILIVVKIKINRVCLKNDSKTKNKEKAKEKASRDTINHRAACPLLPNHTRAPPNTVCCCCHHLHLFHFVEYKKGKHISRPASPRRRIFCGVPDGILATFFVGVAHRTIFRGEMFETPPHGRFQCTRDIPPRMVVYDFDRYVIDTLDLYRCSVDPKPNPYP
jgi:hypothetical protein